MDNKQAMSLFFLGNALGLILGIAIGACISEWQYQAFAIEHNAAEYDSVTGEWRWKDQPKERP